MHVTLQITVGAAGPKRLERTGSPLTIGRDPDCDFALPDSDAAEFTSSRHAQLSWDDNQLMLADLGSTNGTLLNGQLVTSRQPVQPGDRIQLGQRGPEAVIVEARSTTSLPLDANPPLTDSLTRSPSPRWGRELLHDSRFHTVAAAITVALVSSVLIGMSRDSTNSEPGAIPGNVGTAGTAASIPGVFEPLPGQSGKVDALGGGATASEPSRAVYAVLATAAQNGRTVQVATAWAATNELLVTSASVIEFLKRYHEEFPTVNVECAATGEKFSVDGTLVHPTFARLYSTSRTAEVKVAEERRRLDELADAGKAPAELEELVNQIVASEEQRFLATEQSVFVDVGVLQVSGRMKSFLPIESRGVSRGLQAPLHILGGSSNAADDQETASVLMATRLDCIAHELPTWKSGQEMVTRLQLKCSQNHLERDWIGSPLLNGSGRVIGIFTRGTPPETPDGEVSGARFDATAIDPLKQLLPELFEG